MCKALQDWAARERREGRQEGRQEGRLQALFSLVQDDLLAVEIAAEKAKLTLEEFNDLYRMYQQKVLG